MRIIEPALNSVAGLEPPPELGENLQISEDDELKTIFNWKKKYNLDVNYNLCA